MKRVPLKVSASLVVLHWIAPASRSACGQELPQAMLAIAKALEKSAGCYDERAAMAIFFFELAMNPDACVYVTHPDGSVKALAKAWAHHALSQDELVAYVNTCPIPQPRVDSAAPVQPKASPNRASRTSLRLSALRNSSSTPRARVSNLSLIHI